jgi:hypothetical protein
MAAFPEAGPSRKSIATYGKMVRKRPPDHFIFKQLQELEKIPDHENLTTISSDSPEPGTRQDSPLHSLGNSTSTDLFDFPSSDDEAIRTPQKRRRMLHPSKAMASEFMGNVVQAARPLSKQLTQRRTTGDSFKPVHASVMKQRYEQEPRRSLQKLHSFTKKSITAATTLKTAGNGLTQALGSSSQEPENLMALSTKHRSQGITTSKISIMDKHSTNILKESVVSADTSLAPYASLPAVLEQLPATRNPPVSKESVNKAVKIQPEPAVLTPRAMKMWNGLMNEDGTETLENVGSRSPSPLSYHRKIDRPDETRGQKRSRKRLIDSLVEQSGSSRPALELDDDDMMILESALESQVLGDRGMSQKETPEVQILSERNSAQCPATAIVQCSQISGAKITYGRHRSMLAEQDLSKDTSFDVALHVLESELHPQERRGGIPTLAPLQVFHENDKAQDENSGVSIRTIHELRQAGAQSRFKDEVEDLLDRIGTPAQQTPSRRSGLMDLASKMRNKVFCSGFISNGMDQRLFLHLEQEQDVISGFFIICLLIIVLDAGAAPLAISQLHGHGITHLLTRLVSADDNILSIAKNRKSNMSKSAQLLVSDHHEYLLALRAWDDLRPATLSPRTASLRCLQLMIYQARSLGNTSNILSKELVSKLFDIVKLSCNDELSATHTVDLQLALLILESQSLDPIVGSNEYLPAIRDVLEVALQGPPAAPAISLLLTLVLNTTNNSSTASDIFASPGLIHLLCRAVIKKFRLLSGFIVEDERLPLVNQLVLMLIVMINIAESSFPARRCFEKFQDSSLDDLVLIFLDNQEKALEVSKIWSISVRVLLLIACRRIQLKIVISTLQVATSPFCWGIYHCRWRLSVA